MNLICTSNKHCNKYNHVVLSSFGQTNQLTVVFHYFSAEPLPLMDLCRRVIRQKIKKEGIEQGKINQLNLPTTIKDYLAYKDSSRQNQLILNAAA